MPISNKDVIEAFIADFQSMHEYNQQPDVKCDFDGDPRTLAQVLNLGGIPTLRFSYRFVDDTVSNHADLFYCLIIAGHELAHWANAHTKHADSDDLDSKAIEMWADFYGSRLVLTAIARCSSLQEIIRKLRTPAYDAERENALLPAYGEALRRVYDRVYSPVSASPKYPSAVERVHICGAGVSSFFYRHLGKMHQGMTILALKRVILEPFADLTELFSGRLDLEESSDLALRNIDIHMSLKEGRPLITPGVRPQFNQLVGTHYLGHDENMAHRGKLREQIRAWGVQI